MRGWAKPVLMVLALVLVGIQPLRADTADFTSGEVGVVVTLDSVDALTLFDNVDLMIAENLAYVAELETGTSADSFVGAVVSYLHARTTNVTLGGYNVLKMPN